MRKPRNAEQWLQRAAWRQIAAVTIPLAVMPTAVWFTLHYPAAARFITPEQPKPVITFSFEALRLAPEFASALQLAGRLVLAAAAIFAIGYALAMLRFRAAVRERLPRRDRARLALETLHVTFGLGALALLFMAWPAWMILAAAWLAAGCALQWRLARQAGLGQPPRWTWPVAALLTLPPVLTFGAMRISAEYHQARAAERLEAIYADSGGFIPFSEMERVLPPLTENGAEHLYAYMAWQAATPAAGEALYEYYKSPDGEHLAAMLAAHAAILPALDRLGEAAQIRFRHDWSRPDYREPLPELSKMRAIAQLQKLRMIAAAADGDYQLAEQLWRAIGNYRRQLTEDPYLISGLVAIALEAIRVDGFMICLNEHGPLPEEWLRAVIADAPQAEAGFRAAHRRNIHTEIAGYIASEQEKLLPGCDSRLYTGSATFRQWFAAVNLDRFLEVMAPFHAGAGRDFPDIDRSAREDRTEAGSDLRFALADTMVHGLWRSTSAYSAVYARLRSAAAMAALELYRDRHGDYPATLEALVPEFLDQVPLNPFDGEAMRYEIRTSGGRRRIEIACDGIPTARPQTDALIRVIGTAAE